MLYFSSWETCHSQKYLSALVALLKKGKSLLCRGRPEIKVVMFINIVWTVMCLSMMFKQMHH